MPHIQKLLGFSALLQTISTWFCTATLAGITNFCGSCFIANTADVPTWGMLLLPFRTSLSNSSDVFMVIIYKKYLSTNLVFPEWCCSFTPSQCWEDAASACSGFLIKMGTDMQADLRLFLKNELEGYVPLNSPGDVEGFRCLGSEGLSTPCIIWCNASACFYNALVIQHHLSVSVTSEDGTDWAEEDPGGLGFPVLHRDPGREVMPHNSELTSPYNPKPSDQ